MLLSAALNLSILARFISHELLICCNGQGVLSSLSARASEQIDEIELS